MLTSETAPTKISVAIASIVWAIIMLLTYHVDYTHVMESTLVQYAVALLFFIYGAGLIWRVFDTVHRMMLSCVLTFFGSALWILMTWSMIFAGVIIPEVLAANISITLASCWLFVRAGSGEIISIREKQVCVLEKFEICKHFTTDNRTKEKE